jgi:hypothetical protein
MGAGCVANIFQGRELSCGKASLQQVDVIGHVWFAGSGAGRAKTVRLTAGSNLVRLNAFAAAAN